MTGLPGAGFIRSTGVSYSCREVAILTELLLVLILTLINGLFSGAELAVLSLRKTRIKELFDEGHRSAKSLLSLRENPERFLATVQIGITVVGATAGTIGGSALAQRLAPVLAAVGLGSYAPGVSLALVVILLSFLSLVLGELVPKSLALKFSEGYSMVIGRPLWWLSQLARPLVWLLTASSNLILRLFNDQTTFTESRLSPEELRQLVEEAAKAGSLDPKASEIASRAFEFGSLTVAHLAVPRTKIEAIPAHATHEELRRLLIEKTHNRYPVYQDTADNIIGYVTVKDLLGLLLGNSKNSLLSILRKVYFAPANALATRVLRELQRRRTQLAVIVDEHGGLYGLVTAEDLFEELVGNVSNEDEAPDKNIQKEPDGAYLMKGITPLRIVNRALSIELEEWGGQTTLAGYCISLAGRIPEVGVTLKAPDGTRFEILEATPQRVDRIKVWAPPKDA